MKNNLIKIGFGFLFLCVFGLFSYSNLSVNASDEQTAYNSNNNYTYTTNINNPIGIDDLIDTIDLTALDEGFDITSNIKPYNVRDYYSHVLNQPNALSRILGTYPLTFRCYDAYGNYSECVINVEVIDNTAPVVDEENSINTYVFKKTEICENTVEVIKNNIKVRDNHDYTVTKEFQDSDFDINSLIGFNNVVMVIKDSSNNQTTYNLEIEVIDEIGPEFSCTTNIITLQRTTTPLPFEDLVGLFEIEAYDKETQSHCIVSLVRDDYTENANTPGTYLYRVKAQDSNENETVVDCFIEVIDDNPPVFYLSTAKVSITTKVTFDLTEADKMIKARSLAKSDHYELEIEKDNYTDNCLIPGSYLYRVKATYEDDSYSMIDFMIDVKEVEEQDTKIDDDETPSENEDISKEENESEETVPEKEKVGFFKQAWSFIKKAVLFIWKLIKWPIEKLIHFGKKIIK